MKKKSSSLPRWSDVENLPLLAGQGDGAQLARRWHSQLVFDCSNSRPNGKSSLSTTMAKITQTAKASAQLLPRAKISQE